MADVEQDYAHLTTEHDTPQNSCFKRDLKEEETKGIDMVKKREPICELVIRQPGMPFSPYLKDDTTVAPRENHKLMDNCNPESISYPILPPAMCVPDFVSQLPKQRNWSSSLAKVQNSDMEITQRSSECEPIMNKPISLKEHLLASTNHLNNFPYYREPQNNEISQNVIDLSVNDNLVGYRIHLQDSSRNPNSEVDGDHQPWHVIADGNEQDFVSDGNNPIVNSDENQSSFQRSDSPTAPSFMRGEKWNNVVAPLEDSDVVKHVPNIYKIPKDIIEKKDASCQVEDFGFSENDLKYQLYPFHLGKQNNPLLSSTSQQEALSLATSASDSVTATSNGTVHNGVRPELYTEEQNMVIESGVRSVATGNNSGLFSCHHCIKIFRDSRSLQRHLLIHDGLRSYRCPICDKAFMLKGDLTRHVRIHSGEKPYVCDICNRRFTLKGNLMQHCRTHMPEKQFTCTICSKNYAQKDSLHRHIRAHFGDKPFECNICKKRFTLRGDLSRHHLIHSGIKPHACQVCGRTFALKGNLTQHIRIHIKANADYSISFPKSPTKNTLCELTYPEKSESYESNPFPISKLIFNSVIATTVQCETSDSAAPNTLALISSDETELQSQKSDLSFCSACSKTFSSPESLQEHVQLVHEQSTQLAPNRFLCNICQKEFVLKGDLVRHLNSHNGVKPYRCEQCDKRFTLRSNLRQHLTTHQKDKTYSCPLCNKMFGNRRNMSLHLKRHEHANANFTCTKCGRSFLAKSDHFFHNCTDAASPEHPNALLNDIPYSTPSSSPINPSYQNDTDPDPNVNVTHYDEKETENPLIKEELTHNSCSQVKTGPESISQPEYGPDSYLNPFYRHLYFATSHQTILPSFKGLLSSPSENIQLLDGKSDKT